ncbi:MAG: hypothetical protein JWL61_3545 [Gemmatimonadetes bacterium]|jgi:hypothetical protein|nr:hypothetical protein [Gemmatimonadota bacterium]
MRMKATALLWSFFAMSCDRPSSQHTYSSPAPPPPIPAGATSAITTAPEIPLGAMGPGARLVSVTDAATGVPVALGSITDSIDVLTLVAFGPAEWTSREGGRVELELRGPSTDTTYVHILGTPAPSIAAHTFRITGLKVGRYSSVIRLRMTSGHVLAASIPLALEVVQR